MKIFIIFAFTFLCSVCSFGQKYAGGSNFPYHNPTPGEITIMAISPLPDGMEPDLQAFQNVVDCGFNLVSSLGSVEYFKKVFSILGDLKLKYLISNPQFVNKDIRESYITEFNGDPHLGGWKLVDEPFFNTWQELSQQYKMFNREDNSYLVYINLIGKVYNKYPEAKNMSEYLGVYQRLFTPSLFSYDFYPVITRNGKITIEYDQFYSDLEDFSSVSKKYDRPFWAYCECMSYTTDTYSRPTPTEEYFKFEAYNALAYGAQGIVYWSYGLRKPAGGETYQSALVDLKGKKSKAWFGARSVNYEIKRFNDVFYQCDVKEVRHTGDKIYTGTKKLSGSFGPFSRIKSGSAGLVVSRIENNGEKYIVVVNRDVFNKQKITLLLSSNRNVMNLTSSGQTKYSGGNEINLTLGKADWVIFKEI